MAWSLVRLIVRVSVDLGTAFDIAAQGIAREGSMVLACERAAQLAPAGTPSGTPPPANRA